MSAPKFSPKWEGPYVIIKAVSSRYYKILAIDGGVEGNIINGKFLKTYYA